MPIFFVWAGDPTMGLREDLVWPRSAPDAVAAAQCRITRWLWVAISAASQPFLVSSEGEAVHDSYVRRQIAQDGGESLVRFFVLPDPDDCPTDLLQPRGRVPVPLEVRLQLGLPPCSVVRRPGPVLWAAMPEATIDEYGNLPSGEHDVAPAAGHAREGSVHQVSIPEAMEGAPQRDLRSGVASPLLRHPPRGHCIG